MSLGTAAQDSRTGAGVAALPDQEFNYVRNSVKATVDAYDGTVTLYAWDAKDPVLKSYEKAFPGIVKPKSAMSAELVSHVRYPEDLFKLQREVLTRYHVSNARTFYAQSDRWQVPSDPTENTQDAQPPYYLLAQRPGDATPSYQLTSALNAFNRQNLSAFISASSDPRNYGQMQILSLPGNTPFRGPQQVQQTFITNDAIRRDLTLFNSNESKAVFGNLLTLPIGTNGLLYVEPLYVQGNSANSFPLLRKVLVDYGDRVGYADTLADALSQAFGAGAGSAATDSGSSGSTSSPSSSAAPSTSAPPSSSPPATQGNPALTAAVQQINAALAALATAQRTGDFAGIGTAEQQLQAAVQAYQAALAQGTSSSPAASTSAAPASSAPATTTAAPSPSG
jgi:uncharacterized membrane protein (UPF0182 family)